MIPRTFDEHLANVIESKRAKRNMTVEELADAVGIKYQTLRRRLSGSPLMVTELERLAVVVDVPAAELVDEALNDYGGIEKLIAEHMSEGEGNVTAHDNVSYMGRVKPPLAAAADENPRAGETD